MQGIKPHSHQQRAEIITQLIPKLQEKYGENLVAIGGDGSYGRNEDKMYSDLEILIFLQKFPSPKPLVTHQIIGGLLIVLVPTTRDEVINEYLDVKAYWYAAGASKLSPILNQPFIDEINAFVPDNIERKCLKQIRLRWYQFQEITAKVLNSIESVDAEAFGLAFPQMVKELLIIMSYLNQTPYITLGTYIAQARKFTIKPTGFDSLIDRQVEGNYENLVEIRTIVVSVFASLEKILLDKQIALYDEKLL